MSWTISGLLGEFAVAQSVIGFDLGQIHDGYSGSFQLGLVRLRRRIDRTKTIDVARDQPRHLQGPVVL